MLKQKTQASNFSCYKLKRCGMFSPPSHSAFVFSEKKTCQREYKSELLYHPGLHSFHFFSTLRLPCSFHHTTFSKHDA